MSVSKTGPAAAPAAIPSSAMSILTRVSPLLELGAKKLPEVIRELEKAPKFGLTAPEYDPVFLQLARFYVDRKELEQEIGRGNLTPERFQVYATVFQRVCDMALEIGTKESLTTSDRLKQNQINPILATVSFYHAIFLLAQGKLKEAETALSTAQGLWGVEIPKLVELIHAGNRDAISRTIGKNFLAITAITGPIKIASTIIAPPVMSQGAVGGVKKGAPDKALPSAPKEATDELFPPTVPPKERAVLLRKEGERLLTQGDKWGSFQLYVEAVRLDPDNPVYAEERGTCARMLLAEAGRMYQERRLDPALDRVTALHTVFPKQSAVLFLLGKICFERGIRKDAEAHFAEAFEIDPGVNDQKVFHFYGQILFEAKEYPRAVGFLKKVNLPNELDQVKIDILVARGFQEMGEDIQAEQYFDHIMDRFPPDRRSKTLSTQESYELLFSLAVLKKKLGKYEEALACAMPAHYLRKSLPEINALLEELKQTVRIASIEADRIERARIVHVPAAPIPDTNTLVVDEPEAAAGVDLHLTIDYFHRRLKVLKPARGDWDWGAIASLVEKALRVDPDDYEMLYHFGFCLWQEKRYEEAFAPMQKAVLLRPYEIRAVELLARVQFRLKMYPESEVNFLQVLQKEPENFRALRGLALAYNEMDRFDEALPCFEAAIRLALSQELPRDMESMLREHYADALAGVGRYEEAEAEYRRAAAINQRQDVWIAVRLEKLKVRRICAGIGGARVRTSLADLLAKLNVVGREVAPTESIARGHAVSYSRTPRPKETVLVLPTGLEAARDFVRKGDLLDAVPIYLDELKGEAHDAVADEAMLLRLALLYRVEKMAHLRDAAVYLNAALEIQDAPDLSERLITIYLTMDDPRNAYRIMLRLHEAGLVDFETVMEIAKQLRKRRINHLASSALEICLEMQPDNRNVMYELLMVYLEEKRYEDKRRIVRKLLERKRTDTAALNGLFYEHLSRGNPEKAWVIIREIERLEELHQVESRLRKWRKCQNDLDVSFPVFKKDGVKIDSIIDELVLTGEIL